MSAPTVADGMHWLPLTVSGGSHRREECMRTLNAASRSRRRAGRRQREPRHEVSDAAFFTLVHREMMLGVL